MEFLIVPEALGNGGTGDGKQLWGAGVCGHSVINFLAHLLGCSWDQHLLPLGLPTVSASNAAHTQGVPAACQPSQGGGH